MKVSIKTPFGKELIFTVKETCIIRELKEIIEREQKIPVFEQILLLNQNEIEKTQKLIELNLQQGSFLILEKKCKSVIISLMPSTTFQIDCDETDLVSTLKQKISQLRKININSQSLFFNKIQLQNSKKLLDYDIGTNDAISLSITNSAIINEEKARTFLTCPCCNKIYINPKILNCLHSACFECLKKRITTKEKFIEIFCHICKEITAFSEEKIEKIEELLSDSLPVLDYANFFYEHGCTSQLQGDLELLLNIPKNEGKIKCAECKANSCFYTCTCSSCNEKQFCIPCLQKILEKHIGNKQKQILMLHQKEKDDYCQQHKKPKENFCFACNLEKCDDCLLNNKINHPNIKCSTFNEEYLKNLGIFAVNLNKKIECLNKIKEDQETIKKKLKKKEEKAKHEINEQFVQIQEILNKRKEEILKDISENAIKQEQMIQEKQKEVESFSKKIQDFLDIISVHFPKFEDSKENPNSEDIIPRMRLSCVQIEKILKLFKNRENNILEEFPSFFPVIVDTEYIFPKESIEVVNTFGIKKLNIFETEETKLQVGFYDTLSEFIPSKISNFDQRKTLCYEHFIPFVVFEKNSDKPLCPYCKIDIESKNPKAEFIHAKDFYKQEKGKVEEIKTNYEKFSESLKKNMNSLQKECKFNEYASKLKEILAKAFELQGSHNEEICKKISELNNEMENNFADRKKIFQDNQVLKQSLDKEIKATKKLLAETEMFEFISEFPAANVKSKELFQRSEAILMNYQSLEKKCLSLQKFIEDSKFSSQTKDQEQKMREANLQMQKLENEIVEAKNQNSKLVSTISDLEKQNDTMTKSLKEIEDNKKRKEEDERKKIEEEKKRQEEQNKIEEEKKRTDDNDWIYSFDNNTSVLYLISPKEEKSFETINLSNGKFENYCACIKVGQKIYSFGGASPYTNHVFEVDIINKKFIEKAPLSIARAYIPLTLYKNSILSIGGYNGNDLNNCEQFFYEENKMVSLPGSTTPRQLPAIFTIKSTVYSLCGYTANGYVSTMEKMDLNAPDRSWKAVNYRNAGNIVQCQCWQTYQISENEIIILGGNQNKTWILKAQNENDLEIISFKDLPSTSSFYATSNPERRGNKVFFFDNARKLFIYEIAEKSWRHKEAYTWK